MFKLIATQLAAVLTALMIVFVVTMCVAHASGGGLQGWAWSSNIGWVSFSSGYVGAGTGGTYGVSVDSTGHFDGYAWSPNIGWVSFHPGDLTGCPSSSGCQPVLNITTGAVTGWARACAGTINGNCSGDSRTDGWDGWIELSGTNHVSPQTNGNGGVTFVPNASGGGHFVGYAWGSSVVGWLSFSPSLSGNQTNCVDGAGVCCPSCSIPTGPAATCSISPANLPDSRGSYTTAATASVSAGTGPYTYQWSDGTGFTNGYVTSATQSFSFPADSTRYTRIPFVQVKDTATGNTSATAYCGLVTIASTVNPTGTSVLALKVDSSYGAGQTATARVRKNHPFKLYTTADNPTAFKGCTANSTASPANTAWNGSGAYANYSDSAKAVVMQREDKITYTISCSTDDPDFTPSASIDVTAVSPSIQEL